MQRARTENGDGNIQGKSALFPDYFTDFPTKCVFCFRRAFQRGGEGIWEQVRHYTALEFNRRFTRGASERRVPITSHMLSERVRHAALDTVATASHTVK